MRLEKYNLKAIWNKKVARHFSEALQAAHELRTESSYIVITRSDCNLKCFSCSMKPHKPGPVTTPAQLDAFLTKFDGIDPLKWVYLTGGEPTLDPAHLIELTKVAHNHGRRVALMSNGCKADEFNPYIFGYITLDDHETNTERIREIAAYYRKIMYKTFRIYRNPGHFDIQAVLDSGYKSPGVLCGNYGKPALWGDKIYSCCGLPAVERWISGTDEEICDRCWTGWRKK